MTAARLLVVAAAFAAGCGFAVVGDRCPGLAQCGPEGDGDGGAPDGRPADPPPNDGARLDGGVAADGGLDPHRPDGGWAGGDDGGGHAGDGGAEGHGGDGGGESDGPCTAGEQLCGGRCIAAFTDADNCGSCGHVCLSGICLSGTCQDAAFGHLVLMGHDFRQPGINETRELANAVFLSIASPVRVALYREYASADAVNRVLAALGAEAARRGRAFSATLYADRAAFTAALGGFDVALVVPQDLGSDDALVTAGTSLAASFQSFVRAGGVLVVLDGPQAGCAGTWQVVRGLTEVTGATAATGEVATVTEPADAVAVGLTATYRAANDSRAFTYGGTAGVVAVPSGAVLIHEIVAP